MSPYEPYTATLALAAGSMLQPGVAAASVLSGALVQTTEQGEATWADAGLALSLPGVGATLSVRVDPPLAGTWARCVVAARWHGLR